MKNKRRGGNRRCELQNTRNDVDEDPEIRHKITGKHISIIHYIIEKMFLPIRSIKLYKKILQIRFTSYRYHFFPDQVTAKVRYPKVRWTSEQKKVTREYFKANIKIKKPPTEKEIEDFREQYNIMENKDWKKIKAFVYNEYTNH